MADSLRKRKLVALQAALNADTAGGMSRPSGLTVHRFWLRSLEGDDLPVQILRPIEERLQDQAGNTQDDILTVELRSVVDVGSETPDDALDELLRWGHKAIMADETLGGLCIQITPQGVVGWAANEEEDAFAVARQRFEIQSQTNRTDPEVEG